MAEDQLLQQLLLQLLAGKVDDTQGGYSGGRLRFPPEEPEGFMGPRDHFVGPRAERDTSTVGPFPVGMDPLRDPSFIPPPGSDRGGIMGARGITTGATLGAPRMDYGFDYGQRHPGPPLPDVSFAEKVRRGLVGIEDWMRGGPPGPPQPPSAGPTAGPFPPTPPLAPGGGMRAGGYGGIEGGTFGFPPQAAGDPGINLQPTIEQMGPRPEVSPVLPPVPERPSTYGGAGALDVHQARTPSEQAGVSGQLPTAPEKEGDLSRARASGELEKLYAMQALGEGLGGMEVVTAGDILHRTAKGVGPGKPRGQALKSYTDFLGRKEIGGAGAKDAMALQGLKGKQALEAIEAKGKTDIETALASKQDRVLPAGELSAVDAYHNTRRVGKEILGMMDEMSGSLGPLDNMLDNAGAFFGWQQGKTAEFRRMISDMLVRHIREMTGQQMSALEIKNLEKTMPVLKDTAKMARSKLEGVLRHIETRQEQWAKTRRGAGYYVPESLGPVGGPGGTVKHKRTGETQEVDGATLERVRQTPGAWEIVPDAGASTEVDLLRSSGSSGIF